MKLALAICTLLLTVIVTPYIYGQYGGSYASSAPSFSYTSVGFFQKAPFIPQLAVAPTTTATAISTCQYSPILLIVNTDASTNQVTDVNQGGGIPAFQPTNIYNIGGSAKTVASFIQVPAINCLQPITMQTGTFTSILVANDGQKDVIFPQLTSTSGFAQGTYFQGSATVVSIPTAQSGIGTASQLPYFTYNANYIQSFNQGVGGTGALRNGNYNSLFTFNSVATITLIDGSQYTASSTDVQTMAVSNGVLPTNTGATVNINPPTQSNQTGGTQVTFITGQITGGSSYPISLTINIKDNQGNIVLTRNVITDSVGNYSLQVKSTDLPANGLYVVEVITSDGKKGSTPLPVAPPSPSLGFIIPVIGLIVGGVAGIGAFGIYVLKRKRWLRL